VLRRIVFTALTSLIVGFAAGWFADHLAASSRSSASMREAVLDALREPTSLERYSRLGNLLGGLNSRNLDGAVEAYEQQLDFVDEPEVRMMAGAWAQLDAPGAFDRVRTRWPQRYARRVALGEIVYQWAMDDPSSASAAVAGLPASDVTGSDDIPRKLIEGWAQTPDFYSATDYVASLPRSALRQELTMTISREILERLGPEALIQWSESVQADTPRKFRLVAYRKAARMLAQHDPEAAAAWVEKRYGEDDTAGATRIVATQWAEADPDAAFAWLLSRPDDDERSQAIGFAFRDWLSRDRKAAQHWLESATPGPALDPAIDSYARRISDEETEDALAWVARIQDEELRNRAYADIGQQWFRRDPSATLAWLEQADLSAEIAQSIQAPPPPPPQRQNPVRAPRQMMRPPIGPGQMRAPGARPEPSRSDILPDEGPSDELD